VALAGGGSGARSRPTQEVTVTTHTKATPAAPALPFALTSLYDHLDRDTEGYAANMFALAAKAWSAQSGYGLRLWQDWMQAYSQVVLAPYATFAQLSWNAPTFTSVRGRSETPDDEHLRARTSASSQKAP
jgi:hypothetical protein